MSPLGDANLAKLVDQIHRLVLDGGEGVDIHQEVTRLAPLLTSAQRVDAKRKIEARLAGLGPLEEILADDEVSEIMINGPGAIWVERHGRLVQHSLKLERHEIDLLIERIVAPIGRRVDHRSPLVDGRLPDGSRVNVVIPPIALDGPCVTIRRFVLTTHSLEAFASPDICGQVRDCVAEGANMVVSGGTGAGKTTLLNAIAAMIDPSQRIITVEDAAELQFSHPHVVRLEARPASAEGVGELTIRALVRNALRMRPDRLVVGEVRGDEALDLVQALNTGHRGCLSTVHANGPVDVLRRLETLALLGGTGLPLEAIRTQIAAALDIIVHVERGFDGNRRVSQIAHVVGPGEVKALTATTW
ncbi:MAG: CpaF family protein [Acidimicrobiales bacterium]|nr:CpaF family protein [Acidimicrobiales bacterium]MDG2218450.1 CpaF family protein [Acidimicrobiales bacterium]